MATFIWPAEDGWPYPDGDDDTADPSAAEDDDLLTVRTGRSHLLDGLDAMERQVITSTFGLDGRRARSIAELEATTGLPSAQLHHAMGSGLAKLRTRLR